MFHSLHGDIDYINPGLVVVSCSGVGYEVSVPMSTYDYLKNSYGKQSVLTYLQVGESVLKLYGFHTKEEHSMFITLIGMHKVGPSLALRILSGMPIDSLCTCIYERNTNKLKKIKGVGGKLADRLVIELKDKLPKTYTTVEGEVVEPVCAERGSAIAGLVSLGYKKGEATKVIDKVIEHLGNGLSAEELVTQGLQG